MAVLRALEARLRDEGDGDDTADGYYVRTKENNKVGPMNEYQFNLLRKSSDVKEVVSAWRVSGGAFFKVQLKRTVVCDARHACSCKACNHACELIIIITCFACTVGVFVLLFNSKAFEKERQQTGQGAWDLLMFLFALTVLTAIFTVRKLMERWCTASTDVFISEV